MDKPQTVAHDQPESAEYEQELAEYLQEHIKPNLNSGAIPLLARSIAKEIAKRERPADASSNGRAEEDEPEGEEEEQPTGRSDEDAEDESDADDQPEGEADEDDPEAEADEDDEPEAEDEEADDELEDEDDEPEAEGDDDAEGRSDGDVSDFEADMHDLQSELGEDWILRFSVHGDDAWLTAETEDGSQHVEAPNAEVLSEAVQLLKQGGGRSG